MTRSRIIIVEDDPDLRELLAELLSVDYEVTAHEQLTLPELIAAKPDLLFADVHLGAEEGGGWQLALECRAHEDGRHLPIVISTADAYWLRSHAEEIAAVSHLDVLPRPFTLDDLYSAIRLGLGHVSVALELTSPHFVLVADAQGNLTAATRVAMQHLQITDDELPELRVTDIVALPPEWTDTEWTRYLTERWWRGPVTLRDRSGVEVSAEATARIVGRGEAARYVSWIRLPDAAGEVSAS